MKAIIFAGGTGTRLWPISRKKSPKQFEPIINNTSTLQMTYQRLIPTIKPKNIFVSTNFKYVSIIKQQLPEIPQENIIGEPEKKDVGPAVALMSGILSQKSPNEPIIILWSDHLIKKENKFKTLVKIGEDLIKKETEKIIFIGQKPRFPNQNLGWIELGNKAKTIKNISVYHLKGFKYKPTLFLAKSFLEDGNHCWNLGYFISTPSFILEMFKRFSPKIYKLAKKISNQYGKKTFTQALNKYYLLMPEINFDHAILEQIDEKFAYVIVDDIGWSDLGAWEALKEALQQKKEDNVTLGEVYLENCLDNIIYNYESKKLLVGIDLENLIVINTKDALLVAKKTSSSKIKKIVESLEKTEYHRLI